MTVDYSENYMMNTFIHKCDLVRFLVSNQTAGKSDIR